MVFVCRPEHALAGRDQVAASDLREEMILRFPPGWGVRAIVDERPRRHAVGVRDHRLHADDEARARRDSVPLSCRRSAVQGERAKGLRAIPFDDPAMRWNLSAAVSADRQLTAATKTLLAALIQGSR